MAMVVPSRKLWKIAVWVQLNLVDSDNPVDFVVVQEFILGFFATGSRDHNINFGGSQHRQYAELEGEFHGFHARFFRKESEGC
jgi:hypothetical protein